MNRNNQENTKYKKNTQISGVTEIIKGQIKTEEQTRKLILKLQLRLRTSAPTSRQTRKDSVQEYQILVIDEVTKDEKSVSHETKLI